MAVDCVTCHHGLAIPKSLQATLLEIVDAKGTPAAIVRYRELRQTAMPFGRCRGRLENALGRPL